ncbi:hypothetical protein [Coxiella-like endosymbiont]|uniref:hypothetical protein n=1 Tax=Coxiella-like endosymbiont TaxID=1592897 RepID=UPI00272B3C4B|nr:hypothetical protein [Coxiella-like endosymbiont]
MAHIVLLIVTSGILVVAGLQTVLLALQERLLRLRPSGTLHLFKNYPPSITMEKTVFHTIVLGFLFLSILLGSSIYFFTKS